jgi:protein-S-isoprenylcysteine O-methyltransferase Ste14
VIYGESGWTQLAIRNINLLGSGVGVFLTPLLIPPLIARVDAEENLLRAQFGDE